jgi:hypothetical protein
MLVDDAEVKETLRSTARVLEELLPTLNALRGKIKLKLAEAQASPEPPVGVGDWVSPFHREIGEDILKVTKILPGGALRLSEWENGSWVTVSTGQRSDDVYVIRPAGAPLQRGDRGLLDGKIECWVVVPCDCEKKVSLVFQAGDVQRVVNEEVVDEAFVNPSRFLLTCPVWEKEE